MDFNFAEDAAGALCAAAAAASGAAAALCRKTRLEIMIILF
jgi:hypothetical protein